MSDATRDNHFSLPVGANRIEFRLVDHNQLYPWHCIISGPACQRLFIEPIEEAGATQQAAYDEAVRMWHIKMVEDS